MIDYAPYVSRDPEYNPFRIELAIDCETLQGRVRAEIGKCIFLTSEGVGVLRKDTDGDVVFVRTILPSES